MGLRSELRSRILDDVVGEVLSSGVDCATLILDAPSTKILSSCLRTSDLVSEGVLSLQNLHRLREPLRDFTAIYFISPSLESISQLIWDFHGAPATGQNGEPSTPSRASEAESESALIRAGALPRRTGQPRSPMYRQAFVYFTGPIPDNLFPLFRSASDLRRHLRSLKEFTLDFLPHESRVFSTGQPNALRDLVSGSADDLSGCLRKAAQRIAGLCATIRDEPAIRYLGTSQVCQSLAGAVAQSLKDARSNAKRGRGTYAPRSRGCLVILDRSVDTVAPLMHEFTYQAMVHDICAARGEQVLIGYEGENVSTAASGYDKEKNTLILNEAEDAVWEANRHEHIGNVCAALPREMSRFKKDNKMAKMEDDRIKAERKGRAFDVSAKAMSSALSDFGKFAATSTLLSKHINLSSECLKKVERRGLQALATLEQDIAAGFAEDLSTVSKAHAVNGFRRAQDSLGAEERVRLLLLLILSRGGMDATTRETMMRGLPGFTPSIFSAYRALGANVLSSSYVPPKMEDERVREGRRRAEGIQLLRFVPDIWRVCRRLAQNSLPEKEFPYLSEEHRVADQDRATSQGASAEARSVRRRDQKTGRVVKSTEKTLPYLIVFVAGGITYSEMRSLYEVQRENKGTVNMIIGGTELLTPRSYLRALSGETWSGYFSQVKDPLGGYLECVLDPLAQETQSGSSSGSGERDKRDKKDHRAIDVMDSLSDDEGGRGRDKGARGRGEDRGRGADRGRGKGGDSLSDDDDFRPTKSKGAAEGAKARGKSKGRSRGRGDDSDDEFTIEKPYFGR